jgi:phosphatidylserine/phosphatidylglycerophosphate/cardiolipin synthase-like enzyme
MQTTEELRQELVADRVIFEPGTRRDAFVEIIREAQRELVLSIFRCDDFIILDELAAAVDRKVRVRALVTPSAKNWNRKLKELEKMLGSMGAEVRRYAGESAKYHAKYAVADQKMALIASGNLTRKCFVETCDFVLLTRDSGLIRGLSKLFDSDWESPDSGLPADLSARLIVGPEVARPRFLELMERATRSIRIVDHRVKDREVLSALRRRQAAGVAVQVLGAGAIEGLVSHGRLMLVDTSLGVIGSIALSEPSLDYRREVAVILDHPENVKQLSEYFDSMASKRGGAADTLNEFDDSNGFDDDSDEE